MQLQKLTLMMTILLIMFLLLNWTCKKKDICTSTLRVLEHHIDLVGVGFPYTLKALLLNCQVSLVYFMCNLMSYALHPNRRDLKNYSQVLPCFRLLAMVPTFLLKSTGML